MRRDPAPGAERHVPLRRGRRALAGFVNHSGGATGTDRAWDVESSRFGAVSKHWYRGRRTPFGNAPMSDADFIEPEETAQEAARRMCRIWSRNVHVQDLVRRNWCQANFFRRCRSVRVSGCTGATCGIDVCRATRPFLGASPMTAVDGACHRLQGHSSGRKTTHCREENQ